MATNNFKAFALDPNANVMSQADWEALPALLSGFISGPAKSAQVNKAIRQASFIAAALAQYTANKSGLDVLDNGDLNGFITKMTTAFGKDFQALDATLTALAGLATGANKLPYFTGADTASQTDLTSVGRDIIGKSTIADLLTYLGLKELAEAGYASGSLGYTGFAILPLFVGNVKRKLIIQWGSGAVNTAGSGEVYATSLPMAFPEVFAQVIVAHNNSEDAGVGLGSASPATLSTFTTRAVKLSQVGTNLYASNGNVSFRYIAIGY